jgi:hypothetical protein
VEGGVERCGYGCGWSGSSSDGQLFALESIDYHRCTASNGSVDGEYLHCECEFVLGGGESVQEGGSYGIEERLEKVLPVTPHGSDSCHCHSTLFSLSRTVLHSHSRAMASWERMMPEQVRADVFLTPILLSRSLDYRCAFLLCRFRSEWVFSKRSVVRTGASVHVIDVCQRPCMQWKVQVRAMTGMTSARCLNQPMQMTAAASTSAQSRATRCIDVPRPTQQLIEVTRADVRGW